MLSEVERQSIDDAIEDSDSEYRIEERVFAAVERILADRVAEVLGAVEEVLAEPDDTQWWPVTPYSDPPNDDEVVEVQVIAADRLCAALAPYKEDGK